MHMSCMKGLASWQELAIRVHLTFWSANRYSMQQQNIIWTILRFEIASPFLPPCILCSASYLGIFLTEQISLNISGSSTIISLSCGPYEAKMVQFVLDSPSERRQNLTLCGRSKHITDLNLIPGVRYVLLRRYLSGDDSETLCRVQNFTIHQSMEGKFARLQGCTEIL